MASTCAALGLASAFSLHVPQDALLCIIVAMPLGPIGAKLEQFLRSWQNRHYNSLVHDARHLGEGFAPERIVYRALAETAIGSLVCFSLALAALYAVMPALLPMWRDVTSPFGIGWVHMWLAASLGGILAVRWKRAYGLLAAATALLAMSGVFGTSSF